jgi:hypothetical protein
MSIDGNRGLTGDEDRPKYRALTKDLTSTVALSTSSEEGGLDSATVLDRNSDKYCHDRCDDRLESDATACI